jgi:hypothetical protein
MVRMGTTIKNIKVMLPSTLMYDGLAESKLENAKKNPESNRKNPIKI